MKLLPDVIHFVRWFGVWWPVPAWFFRWHVERYCVGGTHYRGDK